MTLAGLNLGKDLVAVADGHSTCCKHEIVTGNCKSTAGQGWTGSANADR